MSGERVWEECKAKVEEGGCKIKMEVRKRRVGKIGSEEVERKIREEEENRATRC